MLVRRAKEILALKIAGGRKLPSDEELSELFLEAMLFICNKCVPVELIRRKTGERVYRNIDEDSFLCYPDKPDFADVDNKKHIMIDEVLTYAAINYVAFLIGQDAFFRTLTLEAIADYNANNGREFDI